MIEHRVNPFPVKRGRPKKLKEPQERPDIVMGIVVILKQIVKEQNARKGR